MFGSLAGGYITEYYHPKWSFLIYGLYGLVTATLGYYLNVEDNLSSKEKKPKVSMELIRNYL